MNDRELARRSDAVDAEFAARVTLPEREIEYEYAIPVTLDGG